MVISKNITQVCTSRLTGKEDFQRPINTKRVERIAKEWDQTKMKPIQVANIGGKLVIWDGQHTAAAARMRNDNKDLTLPCIVDKMTREEAAEHVANQNVNKCNLNSIEQFKASVESAHSGDNNIHRMLMQHKICLKQSYTKNSTAAVGALRSVYKDGVVNLSRTLEIIDAAWEEDGDKYRSDIILAVGKLVKVYGGEFKDKDMIDRLKNKAAITYIRDSKTNRAMTGCNRMVVIFIDDYNKGRKDARRLNKSLLVK